MKQRVNNALLWAVLLSFVVFSTLQAGGIAPPQGNGGGPILAGQVPDLSATYLPVTQKAAASGVPSLNSGSKVVQDPANATATPTANKIVIANGSGKVDGWVTTPTLAQVVTAGGTATGTIDVTGNVYASGTMLFSTNLQSLGLHSDAPSGTTGLGNAAKLRWSTSQYGGSGTYDAAWSHTATKTLTFDDDAGGPATLNVVGDVKVSTTVSNYKAVATAGWGLPAIYGSGRQTGQTAAQATVATYTVGAADGSFEVSANANVTASTTHSFAVVVDYTDETNTAVSLTLPMGQLAGTFVAAITNVTGTGPYSSSTMSIRCKAATAITVKTSGTFTSVTYNVEGHIKQVK